MVMREFGISITDELGITVQGLETVHYNGNDKTLLKRLEEILNNYSIDTIVVGMPINMNGTKTERVEITEKFVHKLKCKFNKVRIETVDERLTTKEANNLLIKNDTSRKKRKKVVDSIAATIILQSYLDIEKNRKGD